MKIADTHFRAILGELIEESPMACHGVLALAAIEFTDTVPTLAVTLGERPVLMVNLEFLNAHARTEAHVKAVILHEFLHIILGHTCQFERMNKALNVALDAVINSILHRRLGREFSSFFAEYYADCKGVTRLLRPLAEGETQPPPEAHPLVRTLFETHQRLMDGQILADDVLELVQQMNAAGLGSQLPIALPPGRHFIGSHEDAPRSVSPLIVDAITRTLQSWNEHGVFRDPARFRADPTRFTMKALPPEFLHWQQTAWKILRDHVTRDPRASCTEEVPRNALLPVLSAGDRRAFLRTLWSPVIPEAHWELAERRPSGTCQVYLDVSGSMHLEMQALVDLLARLRRHIRSPFWAFSDEVKPAAIRDGQLVTSTTGGTSMNAVLAHVAATLPGRAVVITDGYIEACDPALLARLRAARQDIFVLLSRDGSPREINNAGLPWRQLEKFTPSLSS